MHTQYYEVKVTELFEVTLMLIKCSQINIIVVAQHWEFTKNMDHVPKCVVLCI